MEYELGSCFVAAPSGGFPAPAGPTEDLVQAWNLRADPAVDCSDRTAPPTTSTTSPGPSTTTTGPGRTGATPPGARPVEGYPSYTG